MFNSPCFVAESMLDESFCQDSLEGEPACVAQAHEASKGCAT